MHSGVERSRYRRHRSRLARALLSLCILHLPNRKVLLFPLGPETRAPNPDRLAFSPRTSSAPPPPSAGRTSHLHHPRISNPVSCPDIAVAPRHARAPTPALPLPVRTSQELTERRRASGAPFRAQAEGEDPPRAGGISCAARSYLSCLVLPPPPVPWVPSPPLRHTSQVPGSSFFVHPSPQFRTCDHSSPRRAAGSLGRDARKARVSPIVPR